MIDKAKFAAGMGLLAGAFNRTVDAAVSRVYYSILSSRLDTEQFERAVNHALTMETFWPSPARLLGFVSQNPLEVGEGALEHVNRVLAEHGGHLFLPHEKFLEFDEPTRAAIAACGGLGEICNTPIERHPSLVRRFASAYTMMHRPRVTAPPTDSRVKELVGSTAAKLGGHDRRLGRSA